MPFLAQGSSAVVTVTAAQVIGLNNSKGSVAYIEATSGVPGSANKLRLANHSGGYAQYGPFGVGTVTIYAVSGELNYDATDPVVSADARAPVSIFPTVFDTNAASSNRSMLQLALDMGDAASDSTKIQLAGAPGGIVWIDQAIQFGSNTILDLGGLTLKQLASSSDNVLVSKSYKATATAVTLTWVSGNTMSVAWAAHSFVAGDFVCIEPTVLAIAAGSTFVGCFQIQSVTTNAFVVSLMRTPATGPSGSWQARKATVNFHVLNGTLDYNNRGGAGSTASNTTRTMLVIPSYTQGCSFTGLKLKDSLKYGIWPFSVRDLFIQKINCDLISDGVHIFGPAFNCEVNGVYGTCGDDSVAVSSRDVTANWVDVSGGDIIGCTVKNILSKTITACCQIYSHTGYKMEGLEYDQIGGNAPVALNIFGDPTDGGSINDIQLSRISGTGVVSFQIYGAFVSNRLAIGRVRFAHRQHNPIALNGSGGDTLFNVGAGVDISQIVEDYTTVDSGYSASTGGVYLMAVNSNATVRSISVVGGRFNITDSARMYRLPQNMGLKRIDFTRCSFTRSTGSGSVDAVINIDNTVTENPSINFLHCDSTNFTKIVSAKANCRVTSSGCNWGAFSGGSFILVSDAAATSVKLHSAGGNEWGLTPFVTTAGAIEIYGFDLKVDVGATGATKLVSGQYCFNTSLGGARGTLVANRLVTCNGTNWLQVDTPALIF